MVKYMGKITKEFARARMMPSPSPRLSTTSALTSFYT